MKSYLAITKALNDEMRVRALLALREGELCLCQLIETLELAPSTTSKHMTVLYQAGLVERRKEGRWHFYRLASRNAPPMVRRAIRWTLESLADEQVVVADAERVCEVKNIDLKELAACYSRS